MQKLFSLIVAGGIAFATPAQAANHAHTHGIARLDVSVEPTRISFHLDSPLDNLLGFERKPRTDAERRQAQDLIAKLKAAGGWLHIDPAARCELVTVELESAALGLGSAGADGDGHADLDADIEFRCVDAAKATWIDTGLFGFAHLQKVDVQLATPRGQFKRGLKRPDGRLRLDR